jgi:aspartyl aminopeptidase
MGQGVVIKYNGNQRYATSSASAAFFKSVAHDANCPIQNYCTRNDMPCGSTVGPILASNLGIETIDVGIAQLSMHSIREMAAVSDVDYAVDTLSAFLRQRNLSGRLLQ